MATVRFVTGFIPIPGHPRKSLEYHGLGDRLLKVLPTNSLYLDRSSPNDTALFKLLQRKELNPEPCKADNPEKNTTGYHCVNHEKFNFLSYAAEFGLKNELYVWVDYGILHVPGITEDVIKRFVDEVKDFPTDTITIPGCASHKVVPSVWYPCWRFCGGLMVVPTDYVNDLKHAVMDKAIDTVRTTNKLEWEVNTLARVELDDKLPFTWYQADHNETMFTNHPWRKS